MDYDLYLSFDDTPVVSNISIRDKLLIDSGLSLLQNRAFWSRNGQDLIDSEWDLIEAAIAELADRIG